MEIEILNHFKETFSNLAQSDRKFEMGGISIIQIEQLELNYNNGNKFPKALRELLFLAGGSCCILNRLWYNTQLEIQKATREWLNEYNQKITRPFFVIAVYNIGVPFSYIYLDEDDNPGIYQADIDKRNGNLNIKNLDLKLASYLINLIENKNSTSITS